MPQKDAKTDNRRAHKNIKEEVHEADKEDKEKKATVSGVHSGSHEEILHL